MPGREIRTGLNNVVQTTAFASTASASIPGVPRSASTASGELRSASPVSYRDSQSHRMRADGTRHRAASGGATTSGGRAAAFSFAAFNTLYRLRALVEQQPELVKRVAHARADSGLLKLPADRQHELGIHQRHLTTQLVNINTDSWDETCWPGLAFTVLGSARRPIRVNVTGYRICPQGK